MGSRFPLNQIEQALARNLWPYYGKCSFAKDGSLVISIFDPKRENSCLTLFGLAPEKCASEERIAELVESIQADLEAVLPSLGMPLSRIDYL